MMATLGVHEAMGMKVDREAVASLVSCFIFVFRDDSHPASTLRCFRSYGPCRWVLVRNLLNAMRSRVLIWCLSFPVLNVDQFGRFMT